ncbi:MAG: alpha-glucuronidase [Coprobacillaceae bacterium]
MNKLWMNYEEMTFEEKYSNIENVYIDDKCPSKNHIIEEINFILNQVGKKVEFSSKNNATIILLYDENLKKDCYKIEVAEKKIIVKSSNINGALYAIDDLFSMLKVDNLECRSFVPDKSIRMINHWDNFDGSIERGYAGNSIFYNNYELVDDMNKIRMYARMLSSMKINYVTINNVNVDEHATSLMTSRIDITKKIMDIFSIYGIKTMLSLNFAAPLTLGDLNTCDPLDKTVINWWENTFDNFYKLLPEFGGFLVKADSEGRPGPFKYGRTHADGANMLANIVGRYDGILVWRCFVYDCQQDWRDEKIDRARAVYDNFIELDGLFNENVYLQVKSGPIDFQVREPISPLFGALKNTNVILEFQITQEYLGHQIDTVNKVPQWESYLNENTGHEGLSLRDSVCGIAAVSSVGDSEFWTGNYLMQSNLYGYGKLCSYRDKTYEQINREWCELTFELNRTESADLLNFINNSWSTYEKYTSPLGVGFMVEPHLHYGPNIEGYEYSRWGTYHKANCKSIGYDRTVAKGSGYTRQYSNVLFEKYENVDNCPDTLKLFFHKLQYDYVMSDGRTLIQRIYDDHFEGVLEVESYIETWGEYKNIVPNDVFENVSNCLERQLNNAINWRDVINTYFYRKSGIKDKKNRKIYE